MLEEERKKVSFDTNELSYLVYGSANEFEQFLEMQRTVSNDPVLKFNPEYIQVSRKEIMENMARKLVRYHQLFELSPKMKNLEKTFFTEQMPLGLHYSMFILTLRNLCTDKQKKMFLEPALNAQIVGCYCQTELGHGSDVQNLQTTATYDKATESFIINSPTPGSVKWWIGDLGVFCTHACVNAQLIINNKRYGPTMFIVPIRDLKTHKPLEGIEVGDIGPKYGYNAKDNGYARFTNVRIPRENMLMKFTKVTKEGEFQRRGNERISYATMLTIRSRIPVSCFFAMAKAVTIATRYSMIRKQFKNEAGQQIAIIDYQLQQEKVIPYIAEAYATLFTYQYVYDLALDVVKDAQEKNEFGRLNPTHALSSSVKAVITTDTLKAMEVLRRSAGGHGFSSYSGLPGIQTEVSPTATYQGENTILLLQTARFLIKALNSVKKGKGLPDIVAFLEQTSKLDNHSIKVDTVKQFFCPEIIRKIFMNHAYYKLVAANDKLMEGVANGLTPKQSWDQYAGILLTEASTAFTYMFMFKTFMLRALAVNNQALRAVLNKVLCFFGLNKILDNASGYYEGKILDANAFKLAYKAKEQLLSELRPESIGLVEAFAFDDNTLASAIGRSDGKAYQTLIDWARNSNRVNRPEVQQEILKPLLEAKSKIQLPKL